MSSPLKPIKAIMELAIEEAQKAQSIGDYPVGAVIAKGNIVIASAGNRSKRYQDPTLHAEILAIQSATRSIGRDNLKECVLYTTHAPCVMCIGAVFYARLHGLIYGATYDDIKEERNKNNHLNRSWRTMEIQTKELLKSNKLSYIGGYMRKQCKLLFHSM